MSDTEFEAFRRDLEELILILKKIKANVNDPRFGHLDPMMRQSIDFVINNYEDIKQNLSPELLTQMGFPFQEVIRNFLTIIKRELGEEFIADYQEEIPESQSSPQPTSLSVTDAEERIRLIDQMLARPGLKPEAIDQLLDERNDLLRLLENSQRNPSE